MAVDATIVRDLVVVVPGIMGSELVDAEGRALWSVRAGALARAIRTLGKSLSGLALPAGIGDDSPNDGVQATRLLDSLHVIPGLWSPVTGYDGLLAFLRSPRFHTFEVVPDDANVVPNVIPFPYDWRLSNRYNGRRLARVAIEALERWRQQPGMGEAKLVLVCHSMGGLIARWFAEQEGGAPLIRALVTIGTPHRGALKPLQMLVNGLEPGVGPLKFPLTAFARSLPSMYQLLPQYDCLNTAEGRTSVANGNCPGLDRTMLADATAFHRAIQGRTEVPYAVYKVVGIRQPTLTTAHVRGELIEPSFEIDGRNQGGDGTVPRLAAEPEAGRGREVHEVADQHGELQGSRSLLDLVDGIISREQIVWQDAPASPFGVGMAEIFSTEEAPVLRVTDTDDRRLFVTLRDEVGAVVGERTLVEPDGTASLAPLPEGGYRVIVTSDRRGGPSPVSKPFLVFDPLREDA